jgi:glycosyltransferase involved in cell wall biosynthesis
VSGRIRVLQVITSLAGGAGLNVYQLARHLDPDRFDVKTVFGTGYPLDAVVEREALPHVKLPWKRYRVGLRSTFAGTLELSRILRRERFDIVHTHCSLAGAVGRVLARLFRVPHVLYTVHVFASREYQPAWRKRVLLMIERGLDRCTDLYLVTTQVVKREIVDKRISSAERVSVVPLGIDIAAAPTSEQRVCARALLGLAQDALVVATAGRLEEQKGNVYLLRSFAKVLEEFSPARLVIFGDGPLDAELRAEAGRLGVGHAVLFAGWRTDLDQLLCAADIFCLASLWETFGYVLLEAMAARLPIVASRVEGIPEVTNGEECALLVPPADVGALAAALNGLLRDAPRRAAMAERGRRRLEREYALPRMIARMEDIYLELAGAKEARR